MTDDGEAFGRPGSPPTWTSGAKDFTTTGLGGARLWVTLAHGVPTEVYWPSTGRPQVRDLGFLVAGEGWWREVRRERRYHLSVPGPCLPLVTVVHQGDRYQLTLELVPDPARDVLLIRYELAGDGARLYPLVNPRLGETGRDNTGWVAPSGELLAESGPQALCLAAGPGFSRGSAGYVGASDGWQDFHRNGRLTRTFGWAGPGNVALIGELPEPAGVLALALAVTSRGAQVLARASLADGVDAARRRFRESWQAWAGGLRLPAPDEGTPPEVAEAARLSATVLRVHEDRTYPGAVVASLSVPWGEARNDPGGYHLVWPRDAVETGLGLAAAGQADDARRLLAYLVATQLDDGRWAQCFFPDGRPHWSGVQLDEIGFPVLLAARMAELGTEEVDGADRMTRRALGYLARHGPVGSQDRWEESPGASPFTLGVEVAALVAGAATMEGADRDYALALADCWNERIEDLTYLRGGELSRRFGVDGHYVRIGPRSGEGDLRSRTRGGTDHPPVPGQAQVGLEFLYLCRLGLRDPHDRRIRDTLTVAEALLGTDTPSGRAYYRYENDRYGEREDGGPFQGDGVGRPWPLLSGERGHFALQAGEDPLPYLTAMTRMRGPGGLLPEQIWDGAPIPERDLYPGKPSGSAMPLLWAHGEFVKLVLARRQGRPFERVRAVWERYRGRPPAAATWYWRDGAPFSAMPADRALVVEGGQPFTLHVGVDGWRDVRDRPSRPLGLGMHGVRLAPAELGGRVDFTRRSRDGRWEGRDHQILVGRRPADRPDDGSG